MRNYHPQNVVIAERNLKVSGSTAELAKKLAAVNEEPRLLVDAQAVDPYQKTCSDFFIFILLSRESDGGAMHKTNPDSLISCLGFPVFRLNFAS